MKPGSVHSLALASMGSFKPLALDVGASALKKQLQEERALRVAAIKALSDDADEDAQTAARLAELEGLVATLTAERDTAQAQLLAEQGLSAGTRGELTAQGERLRQAQADHGEESRLRAQAEAFYTASMSSLDEANRSLAVLREQLLQSEIRVTELIKQLRRPSAASAPVPYILEVVERAGPGGDLRKLRLAPDLTPKE